MNVREQLEEIYAKNSKEKTAEDVLEELYDELMSLPVTTINDDSDPNTTIMLNWSGKNIHLQHALVLFVSDIIYYENDGTPENRSWYVYWRSTYTPTFEDFKKWCGKHIEGIVNNKKCYIPRKVLEQAKFIHICQLWGDKSKQIPVNCGKGVDLCEYLKDLKNL